ncbi:MAG: PHP-associated domain-containing protein [Anaeromyxobacteraceae bacterium]
MLVDLHVHSHHTPGCALAPRDLVRRAKAAGLDGLVLTDVNTLEGLSELRDASREESFPALVGVEITTDHGHYLCFFPDPERLPALPQVFGTTPWPVREVLRFVQDKGGVAVAAHPYDKTVDRPSGDFIFTVDGLSAIQGLCGRAKAAANDLAVEAADHMNLPCVAGSGAHASLDEVGKVATLFREPVRTEQELVAQIRAGGVYCVAIGAPSRPSEPHAHAPRRDRGPERRGGERGGRGGGDRRGGGGGRGPSRGGRERR